MRELYSIDFEPDEIDAVREFIAFHAKRLKVPNNKVFVALAAEWKKQRESGLSAVEEKKPVNKRSGKTSI